MRFYLPYSAWTEEMEAVECILYSTGMIEEGMVSLPSMSFPMLSFQMPEGMLEEMPWGIYPFSMSHKPSVNIYTIEAPSEEQLAKLASYGIQDHGDSYFFERKSERAEHFRMNKLSIAHEHIPIMATMVGRVLASKRLTEHMSFCRWMERGGIHGMDQGDWYSAEHEEGERIRCIIQKLSICA